MFKYGISTPLYFTSSAALLLIVKLLLNTITFKKFNQLYQRLTKGERSSRSFDTEKLIYSINVASKIIPSTCLQKSLILKYYLRTNPDYSLVIGVSNKTKFEAHAWVSFQEKIIFGEIENNGFAPIYTLK